MSVMSHFLGLWLVKNIIVIEVDVDELHKGKILSRLSTLMTISAVAQENKKNKERLSWAVPHSEINLTKNCPTLNLHTAAVYVAMRNFFVLKLGSRERNSTSCFWSCNYLLDIGHNKFFICSKELGKLTQPAVNSIPASRRRGPPLTACSGWIPLLPT